MEALEALREFRYILYGGTRGPGKSYWLRWTLFYLLVEWYRMGFPGVHVMLACETYGTLADRQITKINSEFKPWMGKISRNEKDGLGFFLAPEFGGGIIKLRNLDDPDKYKGGEYAAIGVDQLEQNPIETFNTLRGSMRWPGLKRTYFLATGNPLGIGHSWNVAYWLEGNFPKEMNKIKSQFKFIRAKPEDNKYLSEEYWDELRSMTPRMQKAWLEGDYYVFQGQAFPAYMKEKHVKSWAEIRTEYPEFIEKFDQFTKWRAVDWGYTAPFCALWGARDPDNGRVFVYREIYATEKTDRQQARMIIDNTPDEEHITITYADPAMWATKNIDNKTTTYADQFLAEGVPLTRADNDQLNGKRKIDRLLEPLPDGKPGIIFLDVVYNLIRTLPYLALDEKNVEKVKPGQEDHSYDTLRYLLTSTKEYQKRPNVKPIDLPLKRMRGL